jgi:heme a synthase
MAVIIYSTLVWTALDIFQLPNQGKMSSMITNSSIITTSVARIGPSSSSLSLSTWKEVMLRTLRLKYKCIAFVGLSGITMISGAFVAGNDAGRAFNTFPKMNDEWIPSLLYNELQPYYRNTYENTATVQFHHRLLRITTACTGLY